MQKYPIGIQNFSELRTSNYLYIDKTQQIHHLLNQGKYYFLSRPRRFGKSLLISILEAIFLGKKELFEGLWIAPKEHNKIDWEKRPVIRLDFGKADFKTIGLEASIHLKLDKIASQYGLQLEQKDVANKFEELIVKLSQEKKVAILIDEYDKPIIEYLDATELEQAQENRAILKQFYSVIKGLDAYIHFFFLTGVSKFSKVSIFSDLNNLDDLTMTPLGNSLLGYTQAELEHYFSEEIDQLADQESVARNEILTKIQQWYNGYSWDWASNETVYNPFSILCLMRHRRFDNFWFETGTPTFLLKLLRDKQLFEIDKVEVDAVNIKSYQIENLDIYTVLFQTGYLTIAHRPNPFIYELKYPNQEVKTSFEQYLLNYYAEQNHTSSLCYRIAKAFRQGDLEDVQEFFQTLLANIPYDLFEAKQEKYYQAIFYLALKLVGYHIEAEVKTNRGRIDAVVQTEDTIYIIEFKVNQSAEEAIQQIYDRKYYEKYQNLGKKIGLIGMNCYDKTIKEWLVEWLEQNQ